MRKEKGSCYALSLHKRLTKRCVFNAMEQKAFSLKLKAFVEADEMSVRQSGIRYIGLN